jgi:ABC-type nitrate/sulfonate/bicarbonate transport system substrate-binding protein
MSQRIITITLALLLILTSACNQVKNPPDPTLPPTIDQMTFMAGYKPQANLPFVGVYVAKEKGFFAAKNLDVIIEHSPGSGQHLQLVAQGKVQVTTQDAAVLLKRRSDPGLPLVSIGLIGQKGQQAFAALKSSGFSTPKDWENHLIGFKGTPPPDLFALIKAAGADLNKIELVNVGFDPRILTEGKVAVYPVYKSNEPYMMQQWGYEIDMWDAADYGIPSLGLAYVTSEETLANQADILKRFLAACMEGILYAEQNPDEAVEIVLMYTGPETDPDHMRFMLESELKDLRSENTDQNSLGWHNLEEWQALVDLLVEYETMQPIDVSKAFTNELLTKP